jgi:hypothetical protein
VQPKLDPARFRDPALASIAGKVVDRIRLDAADGVALFRTSDILGLGAMADCRARPRSC